MEVSDTAGYLITNTENEAWKFIPAFKYTQEQMKEIWNFYTGHKTFNIELS